MKQGSNITNLMCFKEVLIKINTLQHLALLSFFYITLREEIIRRRNFFEIDFAINDSKIKEFFLCDPVGSKKLCGILNLQLTPTDSFSMELIFVRKASTHFLKLSRRILNYFSKIEFSEFHKKDILPVVVIFVLDIIKKVFGVFPKTTFCR